MTNALLNKGPLKHLGLPFCENNGQLKAVNYFIEKLYLRCLTRSKSAFANDNNGQFRYSNSLYVFLKIFVYAVERIF